MAVFQAVRNRRCQWINQAGKMLKGNQLKLISSNELSGAAQE